MATGFTVVPPLGDGVKRLLALHTQCDFLLSDGSGSSLSQLHAALREAERPASVSGAVAASLDGPLRHAGLPGSEVGWIRHLGVSRSAV